MKIGDLFPSKYIQAKIDLLEDGYPVEVVVTIDKVGNETFKRDDGSEDTKPVLSFKETDKSLILNKTNFNVLLEMYPASDTEEWEGKRVTLFAKEVDYRGQPTWGTRISQMVPKSNGNSDIDPFDGPPEPETPDDFPF